LSRIIKTTNYARARTRNYIRFVFDSQGTEITVEEMIYATRRLGNRGLKLAMKKYHPTAKRAELLRAY